MPQTKELPDEYERQLAAFGTYLAGPPNLETGLVGRHTQRAYLTRVRQYLAWLDTADLAAICPGSDDSCDPLREQVPATYAIRDYRRHLQTVVKRSTATVNAHLTAIHAFYTWIGVSPEMPKWHTEKKRSPKWLTEDEERRVVRAAEQCSPRDRLIIALMRLAGLRISEVAALDLDDLPFTERKGDVIVRSGKGEKPRDVTMHRELRSLLRSYLPHRRAQSPRQGHEHALLLARTGARFSESGVRKAVARVGAMARIDGMHPHRLRHTFGSRMVRAGNDLVVVAELMGHHSVETTRIYATSGEQDRKAALSALYSEHEED